MGWETSGDCWWGHLCGGSPYGLGFLTAWPAQDRQTSYMTSQKWLSQNSGHGFFRPNLRSHMVSLLLYSIGQGDTMLSLIQRGRTQTPLPNGSTVKELCPYHPPIHMYVDEYPKRKRDKGYIPVKSHYLWGREKERNSLCTLHISVFEILYKHVLFL